MQVAVAEGRTRVGCDRCVSICHDGPVGPHRKSCGCECTLDGCPHAAPWAVQLHVTEMQRKLREQRFAEHWHPPFVFDARRHFANLRREFRRVARWWELNALRRYAYQPDDNGLQSWERDLQYAHNYRWFVELMDAGRRVTADAHGVYVDGELASKVQDRERRAEQRKRRTEERWAETARREGERPENPYRARAVAASDGSGYGGRR